MLTTRPLTTSLHISVGEVVQGEHGAVEQLQDQDGGEGVDPPTHAHHPGPVLPARLRQLLMRGREPSRKLQVNMTSFMRMGPILYFIRTMG